MLKAVARVSADPFHGAEEASLPIGIFLEELVQGLPGVEGEIKGAVMRRRAPMVLLQGLGDLAAGWEQLLNAMSVPIHHRPVPQKEGGGSGMDDMFRGIFAQHAVQGRLTYNGFDLRFG